MAKKRKPVSINEPLRHPDHPRPVTRRDFLRQGFLGASAMVTGGTLLKYLLQPQLAMAATTIDPDIVALAPSECAFGVSGHGKIPFICFDLAGGANIAGSNVMVGGPGGQLDSLTTAGYAKLGIGSDNLPGAGFIDTSLGLTFHSRSAMLAGINATIGTSAPSGVNGFIIPAISNTDTNSNPHNPMYGIAQAGIAPSGIQGVTAGSPGYGAKGSLLSLIGTVASVSGGNSISPAGLIVPSLQPTKIASPSDDTGLVSTGNMTSILTNPADVVRVSETIARISGAALDKYSFNSSNAEIKNLLTCAYTQSVDTINKFATGPSALDPTQDTDITNIFSPLGGINANSAYRKTASVMKLVLNGYAGAGTVELGGYDYHTGERGTGERQDLIAGQCIGACLAYAAAKGVPLMVYVFSDGSLFSNGTTDSGSVTAGNTTVDYTGKGVWTGDMTTTACSFSLIYSPNGRPQLTPNRNGNNQLGAFQPDGNVQTGFRTASGNPVIAANDVTALVYTVLLNYMALHGDTAVSDFQNCFPHANLGGFSQSLMDDLIMFQQIQSGPVTFTA